MSVDTAEWTQQDSHNLTVALVARDGHRMALRGRARADAIKVMAAKGVPVEQMADRLRLSVDLVRLAARRAGVTIPAPQQAWWASHVIYPSAHPDRRRERRQRARQRQMTGATR